MHLSSPLALAGLAICPALVLVYMLRRRTRRHDVSALFLFRSLDAIRVAGPRVRRLERSVLLPLEILMVAALALLAARPSRPYRAARLCVVLDDSFSMRASEPRTPRTLAAEALRREMTRETFDPVTLLLVGSRHETLPPTAPGRIEEALEAWRCQSPEADLEASLSEATAIAGPSGRVLVLTDRPPRVPEAAGGPVRWLAFGQPVANVAIVGASRGGAGAHDRVVAEIQNGTGAARSVDVDFGGQRIRAEIEAHAIGRVAADVEGRGALTVRLPPDALPFDDAAVLLPVEPPRVRVDNALAGALGELVDRALAATGRIDRAGADADLVVTDRPERALEGAQWILEVARDADAVAYGGPFVMRAQHPLVEGVSLTGVAWGAGKGRDLPGDPIVLAGGVPLCSDAVDALGRHRIRMRYDETHGTLHLTPAWPVLFANLVGLRARALPGPIESNVRLGATAAVALPPGIAEARITRPSGAASRIAASDGLVRFRADEPGLYAVTAGATTHQLAAHAAAAAESDLTGATTGSWGSWSEAEATAAPGRSLGWLFGLVALAAAIAHQRLAYRSDRA
ncbi:MAG: VWA domain-containing protein [Acidobacteriota bacterium]